MAVKIGRFLLDNKKVYLESPYREIKEEERKEFMKELILAIQDLVAQRDNLK